jgi:hypothetical protein
MLGMKSLKTHDSTLAAARSVRALTFVSPFGRALQEDEPERRIWQSARGRPRVEGRAGRRTLAHLKKGETAERVHDLLAGSGWLPEPLRTPGRAIIATSEVAETLSNSSIESAGEESATTGYDAAMAETEHSVEDEPLATEPQPVAAE